MSAVKPSLNDYYPAWRFPLSPTNGATRLSSCFCLGWLPLSALVVASTSGDINCHFRFAMEHIYRYRSSHTVDGRRLSLPKYRNAGVGVPPNRRRAPSDAPIGDRKRLQCSWWFRIGEVGVFRIGGGGGDERFDGEGLIQLPILLRQTEARLGTRSAAATASRQTASSGSCAVIAAVRRCTFRSFSWPITTASSPNTRPHTRVHTHIASWEVSVFSLDRGAIAASTQPSERYSSTGQKQWGLRQRVLGGPRLRGWPVWVPMGCHLANK